MRERQERRDDGEPGLEPGGHRLNLGCGPGAMPEGWIGLDGSWNAWLAKRPFLHRLARRMPGFGSVIPGTPWRANVLVRDLRRPLPFAPGSVAVIYCSHTLEHLWYDDASRLLKECHRALREGGVIRVVVPDLKAMVRAYLREEDGSARLKCLDPAMTPADALNKALAFRSQAPPRNLLKRAYAALADFHSHKWMYDAESLTRQLTKAGFAGVEERQYLDSRIEDIARVEAAGRLLDGRGVCVEGVKGAASSRHAVPAAAPDASRT